MADRTMLIASESWADTPAVAATSATSIAVGTGTKTFMVEPISGVSFGFYAGQLVTAVDGANSLRCSVTSFDTATFQLVVDVTSATGSGSHDGWTITADKWSRGSWAASLPLANLETDLLYEVARSADATPASTRFMVDLGYSRVIDFLALLDANASISALVRIRLLNVDPATGAFALAYDTGLLDFIPAIEPFGVEDWGAFNWGGKPPPGDPRPAFLHLVAEAVATESTTSLAVGTGTKTFTVADATGLQATQRVALSRLADPFTSMAGAISDVAGASVTVEVISAEGAGTHDDWTLRALAVDGTRHAVSARFVAVDLYDPGNADGFLEAGRLLATKAYQPPRNYQYGWSVQWAGASRKGRARGGQLYADPAARYRRVTFSVPLLPRDDALGKLYELDRVLGDAKPALFCFDPGDATHLQRLTIYAVQEGVGEIVATHANRYSKRYTIEEIV